MLCVACAASASLKLLQVSTGFDGIAANVYREVIALLDRHARARGDDQCELVELRDHRVPLGSSYKLFAAVPFCAWSTAALASGGM
jgi:hypothetical protein